MGGASGWQGGGSCPLFPAPAAPSRREKKIICALSTLPVHCRSVNFMQKSMECVKTLHSQC